MTVITREVRNVNDALREALWWLKSAGVQETSRNGPVLVAPGPVLTTYNAPLERVLFDPVRDANPFFHFFESLWMLAGRNDVEFVSRFNQRMKTFSDDGEVLHGAYGFRWREWFGFDQLDELVKLLREQPDTRRAVLAMWSPSGDLVASEGVGGIHMKDVPCNTHCYFDLRGGALNMSIMCRSNDVVWGAYGANAVHFAFLLEYVAMRLGAPVGLMYQFSHNLHLYTEKFDAVWRERVMHGHSNPYLSGAVRPYPLLQPYENPETWEGDLQRLLEGSLGYHTAFFQRVVQPLKTAYELYRQRNFPEAIFWANRSHATDWCIACVEWLQRRESKVTPT